MIGSRVKFNTLIFMFYMFSNSVLFFQVTPEVKTRRMLLATVCQPRVMVTSCFVYKVIRDLESIDHLCINPILRIGLIHM